METGSISRKIERGKHTTRHSELIPVDEDSYIMDTPGFSSLDFSSITKEELADCVLEFQPYLGSCRFNDCRHDQEPGCAVKEALEKGKIRPEAYAHYIEILHWIEAQKKTY